MIQEEKPLCGFINLLKPPGMSSAQAVGYVRYLLGGLKTGHGGTLDPEASGVLPLMVGKAARLFDYMQEKEKVYIAEVAFGAATDTQDAQGKVVSRGDRYPDEGAIRGALAAFTGQLMQRPPMYSALKQNGQCLYQLARNGQTADVPERPVTVYELTLNGLSPCHGALLKVRCSKGFYVRTLCNDLGEALGCPAHMRFLLRAESGVFTLGNAVTLEALRAAKADGTLSRLVLPPEIVLGHLPHSDTPERLRKPLRNGGSLPVSGFPAFQSLAEGQLGCLWMDGALCAVVQRRERDYQVRTWLGA